MWCDNCLLVFPLRHGAIVLCIFMALYSFVGSIFLLYWGQQLFFNYLEWTIYAEIGMADMSICIIFIMGLNDSSYLVKCFTFFLWPLIIVTCAVRAGSIIFQLNRQQYKVVWDCNNGGQLWGESAEAGYDNVSAMPSGICSASFYFLYIAFAKALLVDLMLKVYAYFLNWRFKSRIEHNHRQVSQKLFGYYV